jgi:hypothetical protein
MNLLDKLKDRYKDKLEQENLTYPAIVEKITNELEETEFVTQLSYGCVLDMFSLIERKGSAFEFFNQ